MPIKEDAFILFKQYNESPALIQHGVQGATILGIELDMFIIEVLV